MTTLEKELLADLRWIVARLEIGGKAAASDALDQARAAIARSEQHADWQAEARAKMEAENNDLVYRTRAVAKAARIETMNKIRLTAANAEIETEAV